jgi:hypothetical protein
MESYEESKEDSFIVYLDARYIMTFNLIVSKPSGSSSKVMISFVSCMISFGRRRLLFIILLVEDDFVIFKSLGSRKKLIWKKEERKEYV